MSLRRRFLVMYELSIEYSLDKCYAEASCSVQIVERNQKIVVNRILLEKNRNFNTAAISTLGNLHASALYLTFKL